MSNINDLTTSYLVQEGGGVGLVGGWNSFLASLGFTDGSIQDRQKAWLYSLGYEGSLQNMLKAYYCGEAPPPQALVSRG